MHGCMPIGTRIRARREELGLTQEDLANAAGKRQCDISRWERGVTPGAAHALGLADALGVSVRWLLTGSDETEAA